MHEALRQAKARVQQERIDHHVAGFIPEGGIPPAASDMVAAGQMEHLVGQRAEQFVQGEGGGKGRVETERLSVCPELGAGFVSLEAQAHGQAAEKRLAQEQCAAGTTHGRFGFPAYGLPLRNCPGIRGDGRIHSSASA